MKRWAAAFAAVIAGVLWRFPPEQYGFYPRCPFFDAFGLLCPGCGATRAAAALLHGHFAEAWHWNALFVAVLFALTLYAFAAHGRRKWSTPPAWAVAASVVMVAASGVARNL